MKSLQGHLLVASPQLLDPNFRQTVILIVQHGENGAMGLVLNRPTETSIDQAWTQVSSIPCNRRDMLCWGGPCQSILMMLHGQPEASDLEVLPGVHFTTDGQKIQRLVQDGEADHPSSLIAPASIPQRFFVGYAGWAAGQLESEMETGSWLTAPATFEHVFAAPLEQWNQVRREIVVGTLLGHSVKSDMIPIDPTLN